MRSEAAAYCTDLRPFSALLAVSLVIFCKVLLFFHVLL
uniref:Uncharacterized protein n=1 Tax=Arundo donax TaxID=35708 RepID=A0A0A9BTT0_ARUDO